VPAAEAIQYGEQCAAFPGALLAAVLLGTPFLIMLPAHLPGVLNVLASFGYTPSGFHDGSLTRKPDRNQTVYN
jgi:hypothetical protein